eukprot:444712-Alexandrium_andersonii.AAC.1
MLPPAPGRHGEPVARLEHLRGPLVAVEAHGLQKFWRGEAEDVPVLFRSAALEEGANDVALLDGEAVPSASRVEQHASAPRDGRG